MTAKQRRTRVPGVKENVSPWDAIKVVRAEIKVEHEKPSTELCWIP